MTTPTKEQPVSGAKELVERLTALDAFLCGEGELDGLWFGDAKKIQGGRTARFWWRRSHLPALTEAATLLERQEQAAGKLVEALHALEQAEATYRYAHDILGAGDSKTGRAWDLMRRAGDNARQALREYHEAHHGN